VRRATTGSLDASDPHRDTIARRAT